MSAQVHELVKVTDHPLYDGFALGPARSLLGRDDLLSDLVPGWEAADGIRAWTVPRLADQWSPPRVTGRVTPFNDYPCLDLFLPAFSERAADALRDLLEPNGELLPLDAPGGAYFFYNVTRVVDGLDRARSACEFWSEPPTTAVDIERYAFREEVVRDLPIFRVYEAPTTVLVTRSFRRRVAAAGLRGLQFRPLWPLPPGTSWRALAQQIARVESVPELSRHTVVVVLRLTGAADERAAVAALEEALEDHLGVHRPDDPFLGRYRERDEVDGAVRLFLSTPDADVLTADLTRWFTHQAWKGAVEIVVREGAVEDPTARERTVHLRGTN